MSSPRAKTFKKSTQNDEYITYVSFIKSCIPLFLRLVASDIHNTETTVSANEFNILKLIFYSSDKLFETKDSQLSSITPFFVNFSPSTKIGLENVSHFLSETVDSEKSDPSSLLNRVSNHT